MSENTLYSLSKELEAINDEIQAFEGEITQELEKRLDLVLPAMSDKVSNIGRWMLRLTANGTALQTEIDRLTHRQAAQDRLKARLRAYLKFCMETAGKSTMDMGTFTVSIAKNPTSVEITDESQLPAKYLEIIPATTRVKKKEILEDLRAEKQVPGASLKQGTRLVVK